MSVHLVQAHDSPNKTYILTWLNTTLANRMQWRVWYKEPTNQAAQEQTRLFDHTVAPDTYPSSVVKQQVRL